MVQFGALAGPFWAILAGTFVRPLTTPVASLSPSPCPLLVLPLSSPSSSPRLPVTPLVLPLSLPCLAKSSMLGPPEMEKSGQKQHSPQPWCLSQERSHITELGSQNGARVQNDTRPQVSIGPRNGTRSQKYQVKACRKVPR